MSSGAIIGDKVEVYVGEGDVPIKGIVKYIPQSDGDSWIIWEMDGTIFHVQHYLMIVVVGRKANMEGKD